jgi:glycosyltransferase involved in cell wall biosynthesis
MKITVVVPVRNEEHSIRLLLQGLLEQTLAPAEIVIVDGGSTDATPSIVEEHARQHSHLHLIRETNALPGKGRNVGAAAATNDWLAFIDAGVSPANDWLGHLAEAVRINPQADVVYGAWEPVTDSFFKECAAIAYGYVPAKEVDDTFIKSRAVFSSLMRRSAWLTVKGFAEELRSAEDLLFMKRIDEAGLDVSYAPEALVRWSMQPTLWRTFRRFVTYSRHNMLAGLWKEWQASVLARYGLLMLCAAILFGLTSWWPVITVGLFLLMLIARAILALWRNRSRYPAGVFRNSARLLVLVPLLATLDAATIVGVGAWLIADKLGGGKANAA